MRGLPVTGEFFSALEGGLTACGFKAFPDGVFLLGSNPADFLSVNGNSYFYIIHAGVVFPSLNAEMIAAFPKQVALGFLTGGVPAERIPFVFAEAERYVEIASHRTQEARYLTMDDARVLLSRLCTDLPQALAPYHDLENAVSDVESTLETGSLKPLLLLLAYLKLNRYSDAQMLSERLRGIRDARMSGLVDSFLSNVAAKYDCPLS